MADPTAILGIDPGSSSGAMCLYHLDPEGAAVLDARNMPDTMQDIYRMLVDDKSVYGEGLMAVMEKVGGTRPGNAAKSARTFAEHVGALKMALIAAEISTVAVVPRKWMVSVCGASVPTGGDSAAVKVRKNYIYADLQAKYPGKKFTKRQADAVGLMHYGRQLRGEAV